MDWINVIFWCCFIVSISLSIAGMVLAFTIGGLVPEMLMVGGVIAYCVTVSVANKSRSSSFAFLIYHIVIHKLTHLSPAAGASSDPQATAPLTGTQV